MSDPDWLNALEPQHSHFYFGCLKRDSREITHRLETLRDEMKKLTQKLHSINRQIKRIAAPQSP